MTRLIITQLIFTALLIGIATAVSAAPSESSESPFKKGLRLLQAENYSLAKVAFLKAIDIDSISPLSLGEGYYHLSQTCFQLKEYEEASQYAQQAITFFENRPQSLAKAYELLGKISFYQKNYDAAAQAFILSLHHNPNPSSKHYMFLAKAFIKNKNLPEAINTLDQAITRYGDLENFHDKALKLEIKLYRYQDATDRIQYLIAQGKRPIHYHIRLGELYHHRGEIKLAKEHFHKAKDLFNSLPANKRKSQYMQSLQRRIQSRVELASY